MSQVDFVLVFNVELIKPVQGGAFWCCHWETWARLGINVIFEVFDNVAQVFFEIVMECHELIHDASLPDVDFIDEVSLLIHDQLFEGHSLLFSESELVELLDACQEHLFEFRLGDVLLLLSVIRVSIAHVLELGDGCIFEFFHLGVAFLVLITEVWSKTIFVSIIIVGVHIIVFGIFKAFMEL
jgi:hypothetical protein